MGWFFFQFREYTKAMDTKSKLLATLGHTTTKQEEKEEDREERYTEAT